MLHLFCVTLRSVKKKSQSLVWYEHTFIWLLIVIFGGVIIYAPLTVALGTLLPHYSLIIKSWYELVMGVATIFGIVCLYQRKQFGVLRQPLMIVIGIFAVLHLLLLPFLWQGTKETLAGILIDLRYLLYFVLVYVALRLYPEKRRAFLIVGLAGALLVTVFAVLQVTVLPNDILTYLGYNNSTIQPYLTVDKNTMFIRVNSTLRGPNPLGAYAGIVLSLFTAYLVRGKLQRTKRPQIIAAVLAAAAVVSVWVSYSRSAIIGAIIGVAAVLAIAYGRKVSKKVWIGLAVLVVIIGAALLVFRHDSFISNVVFHQNLNGGSSVDSNQGHLSSVQEALTSDVGHPLGVGVGSTGSASLYGSRPDIIEDQYLFIAHETGWLALVAFLVVFVWVLRDTWRRRGDWLALGVFASGIGLAIVGVVLPVWTDDTISIVWWGLAAVAIGSQAPRVLQSKHHGGTKHQETTRTP